MSTNNVTIKKKLMVDQVTHVTALGTRLGPIDLFRIINKKTMSVPII